MSELFLEFFTEEMSSGLQSNIRENLLSLFKENLEKNDIPYKSANSYSTPNPSNVSTCCICDGRSLKRP